MCVVCLWGFATAEYVTSCSLQIAWPIMLACSRMAQLHMHVVLIQRARFGTQVHVPECGHLAGVTWCWLLVTAGLLAVLPSRSPTVVDLLVRPGGMLSAGYII